MRENRSLNQRLALALWLSVVFGASVGVRVVSGGRTTPPTWAWKAA